MIRIALFICSILAVFFVIFQWMLPSFSEMKEDKIVLNETKLSLENMQNRIDTFEKMTVFFEKNTNMDSLAISYLPESGYEDRILNALTLAGENSGLYIEGLTSVGATQSSQTDAPSTPIEVATDDAGIQNQLRMKNLEITFTGVGGYESVKQFLSNLASLERGFESSLVAIEKYDEEDSSQESSLKDTDKDALKMEITLNFLYATRSLANWESILESFDPSSRSLSSLEDITKKENIFPVGGLNDLQYTTGGKVNPFLLSSAQ
jgi:hypothetical protein